MHALGDSSCGCTPDVSVPSSDCALSMGHADSVGRVLIAVLTPAFCRCPLTCVTLRVMGSTQGCRALQQASCPWEPWLEAPME